MQFVPFQYSRSGSVLGFGTLVTPQECRQLQTGEVRRGASRPHADAVDGCSVSASVAGAASGFDHGTGRQLHRQRCSTVQRACHWRVLQTRSLDRVRR